MSFIYQKICFLINENILRVNIEQFAAKFQPEDIILPKGSATVNKHRIAADLANLVNYKKLRNR